MRKNIISIYSAIDGQATVSDPGINQRTFSTSQRTQPQGSELLCRSFHPLAQMHSGAKKSLQVEPWSHQLTLWQRHGKVFGMAGFPTLGESNTDRHPESGQAFSGGEGASRQFLSLVIARAPRGATLAELGLPGCSCTAIPSSLDRQTEPGSPAFGTPGRPVLRTQHRQSSFTFLSPFAIMFFLMLKIKCIR